MLFMYVVHTCIKTYVIGVGIKNIMIMYLAYLFAYQLF